MNTTKGGRECGEGRVAFLAILEDVRKAIRCGWTQAAVYRKHRGKLAGITRSQFSRYVRRYVTREGEAGNGRARSASRAVGLGNDAVAPARATQKLQVQAGGGPLRPPVEQRNGFAFKAEDAAKKENLV